MKKLILILIIAFVATGCKCIQAEACVRYYESTKEHTKQGIAVDPSLDENQKEAYLRNVELHGKMLEAWDK